MLRVNVVYNLLISKDLILYDLSEIPKILAACRANKLYSITRKKI